MTLPEAANRLRILADAYHGDRIETIPGRLVPREGKPSRVPIPQGYIVSRTELEAVTFAAAFLGVFVESLENVG